LLSGNDFSGYFGRSFLAGPERNGPSTDGGPILGFPGPI
jgi:hypothetical protein